MYQALDKCHKAQLAVSPCPPELGDSSLCVPGGNAYAMMRRVAWFTDRLALLCFAASLSGVQVSERRAALFGSAADISTIHRCW